MIRFLIASALAVWPGLADPASRLARQGRQAERRGDDLAAFSSYVRAAGARPQEKKYRLLAERVRVRAAQSLASLGKLAAAQTLDPGGNYEQPRPQAPPSPAESEIRAVEQLAEPIQLQPAPGVRDLDFRGDARTLYEQAFRAYGLEVVFDPDLAPGSAGRLRLEQAEFRRAARALMALTETFLAPIHPRVALVAKDTQAKRAELDPMVEALAIIPEAMSVEEANEIGRAVQQVLDIKRLFVDGARRQVLIRDTVTRVRLARALYEELSRRRAEVMIDVELLSASRSSLTQLGLSLPSSFPVSYLGSFWNSPSSSGAGSSPLLGLGGGDSLFGVHIGSADFQARSNRSEVALLTSFRVRAIDGLPASLHIGDKFPIVNALFSPVVVTDQIRDLQESGGYRQPFPSFTFEDLGLSMKVTPRIHDSREVSLTLEAEFRLLTGASVNTLPVISNRKFSSAVRLREGEVGLVAGLAVAQLSHTTSSLGGLARIPLLGRLLGRNNRQQDYSELLLAIRPRLTSLPPAEQSPSRSFHYGSETRPVPSL